METATLTKTEEAHVERMAEESFREPNMEERFEQFAARSISHSKKEEKENEGKYRPREIDLKDRDRSDAEKDFIAKVGQKDEPKASAQESRRSTEKDATAPKASESEKPAAGEPNNSPSEPLSGDRHWEVKFEGKDLENHQRQVDSRVGLALEYINKHPEKTQIEQGMQGFFTGKPPAEARAFFGDFAQALAEVPNGGEVLRHIALTPADREVFRNAKNWKEVRAAVKTISKHYAASAPQPSPKPRAPKPPSEVGGRGAAGDDGFYEGMDFGSFEKNMNARHHARHAR